MELDIKNTHELNIKELKIDLRLYYGYKAKDVAKMKDSEVVDRHKKATENIRAYGCSWRDNGPSTIELKSVDLVTVDIKIL